MNDQLIIGEKASFDDYEASLAKRNIGMPTKKTIKETVPFSNVTYDFSKINGELYWEERELEYVFEIIASTPEKLEELKTAFASWVMNVFEEEIHDPFIPDYHFIGTFDDIDFEDEETLDKSTVTVTFTAYPYKVANLPTVFEFEVEVGMYDPKIISTFVNDSAHRVTAKLETIGGDGTYPYGGRIFFYLNNQYFELYDTELIECLLPVGTSEFEFTFTNGVTGLKVEFVEEVF